MKKAAKRKVSRSVKTKSKSQNSLLLLAILIIALVGIAVWAVIANNPGKTPFALTPLPPSPPPALALTVNWKMPVGYALFRDVGNKRAICQVAGITCSTPTYTYWPGSKINYTVAVKSVYGPVLQTGSTVATSDGRAVANWNWRYEVNVFPDSFGSCVGAGVKCVKGTVNNNNPTASYIAQNLLPSTLYRMKVCAPTCVGGTVIQNTTAITVGISSPVPTTQPIISCSQVDFDHDGSVSILDLTLMSKAYGTKVGDANYNKAYDLNYDGTITRADMDIASGFFGQKCIPTVSD